MRALITGAAGQDGTILSVMFARDGHEVVALVKPGTDLSEYTRYAPKSSIVECDLSNPRCVFDAIVETKPNMIFNFGGISSIMESVRNPDLTRTINVESVVEIVKAMRRLRDRGEIAPRLVAAASGTIFEGVDRSPQTEAMIPEPQSPYARSKADVIRMLHEAREQELFTTSAILYNHESPLRGTGFVTRKITMAVARIAAGVQDQLELGDIEVARDWGWAPDYVRAMRLMLEADSPRDYVLATGISHRLSFFIAKAFAAAGISHWQDFVSSTSDNTRPIDTNILVGDSRAAYLDLGWRHTVDFDSIARRMVQYDQLLLQDPTALWLDF